MTRVLPNFSSFDFDFDFGFEFLMRRGKDNRGTDVNNLILFLNLSLGSRETMFGMSRRRLVG
jgi:hypothetical protein